MIVVAIIGLLAAIAIPNFVRARTQSQKNACINNLRQIDGAVQTVGARDQAGRQCPVAYADILAYLKNAVICPAGGTTFADSYTLQRVTNKPTCQKVSTRTFCRLTPPASRLVFGYSSRLGKGFSSLFCFAGCLIECGWHPACF